jgi:hypothetical protein
MARKAMNKAGPKREKSISAAARRGCKVATATDIDLATRHCIELIVGEFLYLKATVPAHIDLADHPIVS